MKKLFFLMLCLATVSLTNAGTVEHLTFDVDGTATVGSDATLVAGAAITTGGLGISGEALIISAEGDYAQITDYKGIGGSDPRTISLWVKTAANTAGGSFFIGWGDTGGASRVRYDLGIQNGTTDQMRLELNAGATTSATGTTITDDAWHHLAVTWDGTTNIFYLDGVEYGITIPGTVNTVLTEDVVIGTGIRQAFGTTTGRWANGLIDDVQIYDETLTATDIANLFANPGKSIPKALTVYPENGEDYVAVESTLDWTVSAPHVATANYLYFRANDPNFSDTANNIVNGDDTTSPYTPAANLAFNTTYYWRVDVVVDGTTYTGSEWSFTSAPEIPVITDQPDSVTVELGETVVLAIAHNNGLTFQWFKDNDVMTDETAETLTLATVTTADEAEYFCRVYNIAAPDGIDSDVATVWTERLMARWTFDDTLVDTVDGLVGEYTDPNILNDVPTAQYDADGVSGKSLILVGDELHVRVPGTESLFNFYPQGYTFSAWILTEQTGYGAYIAKQHAEGTYKRGILLTHNGANAISTIRQGPGLSFNGGINDNAWHLITGTFDGEVSKLYIDGMLVNESNPVTVDLTAYLHGEPLVIGAETVAGDTSFEGKIDEVNIWSYAVDPYTIAHMYTDVMTEETICVDQIGLEFDVSGPEGEPDCSVDLYDFAAFAATWLNCNSVPNCK